MKKIKILIIDDDEYIASVTSKMLKYHNISNNYFIPSNGNLIKDIIKEIEDNNYSHILCDIEMPLIDGLNIYIELNKLINIKFKPGSPDSYHERVPNHLSFCFYSANPKSEKANIIRNDYKIHIFKKPLIIKKFMDILFGND